MGAIKKIKKSSDDQEESQQENWVQLKTIINILREPILILDKYKKVILANESFYCTFQLEPRTSVGKIVYSLGNSQWNIPSLHKLLEEILPHNHFFKGFEIAHTFPFVGRKVMIINARQISYANESNRKEYEPITIIAMEDVTDMMVVAESLADHAHSVNYKFGKETEKLENYIGRLEKEVNVLKHKL